MIRNNINDVMERTRLLYNSNKPGAIIQVTQIKSLQNTSEKKLNEKKLNDWNFPKDLYEYLDVTIENFLEYWAKRLEVDDDLIPAISPSFGIAEHTAFIGGEVEFSEQTSWHHQLIKNWDDVNKLELREDNEWLRMVIDGIAYLKKQSKGRYAVKLRGAEGAMDIANVIRGNEIFTDFYLYPDELHNLLEFCNKAAEFTISRQIKAAGYFEEGIITGFNIWLPGHSMGHLSEDASTMCSKETYKDFGLKYTKELVENYDHAFMHTHALGKHNIPLIASIDKIDFIEISNDPNCQRAIEIYKELIEYLNNKIVIVSLTLDEIKSNLDFLKKHKTIIWYSADNIEDAKEAVKLVRENL